MAFFLRLLVSGTISGVLAALVLSLAQRWQLSPIFLEADNYSAAVRSAFEIHATFDTARFASLAAGNVLFGLGYGLLLASGMALHGKISLFRGLIWGLAGYAVFFVLPALGLGASIPGQSLADLAWRQRWWLASVSLSSVGLTAILLARSYWIKLAGIVLLLLPFAADAPSGSGENLIPEDLAGAFSAAQALTQAVFWLALGLTTTYLLKSGRKKAHSPDKMA